MFTRLVQYFLRLVSVGIALVVAGVLFGPQAAIAAQVALSKPNLKDAKNASDTAAIRLIPTPTTTTLTDEIYAAKAARLGMAKYTPRPTFSALPLSALATPTAELPTYVQTNSPTPLATHTATPHPSATVTHVVKSTATPTASATPTHSATATPKPKPKPSPVHSVTRAAKVAAVLAYARAQLGERYVLGGAGPGVWDCSGLTLMAFRNIGINIGTHSSNNQFETARAKGYLEPWSARQAGDLVFYGTPGDIYHVAIYAGNGRIIEAANESEPVEERAYWGTPYSQVARFIR